MIKLFSLKEEKAKEAAAGSSTAKVAPGLIRMQKDMSELTLDHGCKLAFPNGKEDLMNFELTIKATDGIYRNGKFVFKVTVPSAYPHDPPKVQCLTTIYHPNIDMEGAVCLNILREDWKPVLTIQSVIMGLQFLILEPNPDDPLNKEAALHMTKNKQQFEQIVRQTFKGRQMRVGDKLYSFPCFE